MISRPDLVAEMGHPHLVSIDITPNPDSGRACFGYALKPDARGFAHFGGVVIDDMGEPAVRRGFDWLKARLGDG